MNYIKLAATAKNLLAKHGRDVTLHSEVSGVYDPNVGAAPVTITDTVLKGDLFDFAQGVTTVRGTLVQAGDKELLLEARSGIVPTPNDSVTVGADVYTVVSMGEINPAGTAVLYQLHVRK